MSGKLRLFVTCTAVAGLLFTVTTSLARNTSELPEVWTTVPIPEKAAYISVHAEVHVRVSNGEEMSLPAVMPDELDTFLTWLTTNRVGLPIVMNIDKRTKYKHVEPVFVALSEHGYNQVYLRVLQKTKPMDPELERFFHEIADE